MKEVSYSIGKSPRLVGIYTENDLEESSPASRGKKPTILLLNSGLLPKTGPFRLYVDLARRFVKMGFNAFRFDFPRVGDSDQHTDARTLDEFYMDDLKIPRSELDWISKSLLSVMFPCAAYLPEASVNIKTSLRTASKKLILAKQSK